VEFGGIKMMLEREGTEAVMNSAALPNISLCSSREKETRRTATEAMEHGLCFEMRKGGVCRALAYLRVGLSLRPVFHLRTQ